MWNKILDSYLQPLDYNQSAPTNYPSGLYLLKYQEQLLQLAGIPN